MRRLETHDWWAELVKLKDEKSLRELAEQFGVTPGAITAALRREGISRIPAPPGPRRNRRASEDTAETRTRTRGAMAQIDPMRELVGTVPDDVIAEKAGVSRRTVANYRKKHGIAGYRGKRRRSGRKSAVDAYVSILGTEPDVVIAKKAGVSANAVRAYRVRKGIPSWRESGGAGAVAAAVSTASVTVPAQAPASRPAAPPAKAAEHQRGHVAWRVTFVDGTMKIVGSSSLADAAGRAEAVGAVASLERLGDMI